ncbi:MAG: UspA domain protein [Pseudonocardiales bacterium]|nr:UspA domain protein [Pseudonocardiales bacterium]
MAFELGTDGPTLILVAVDGSDTSLRAASYAAGLARRQGVRLVVLFVHSYAGLTPLAPAAGVALREANAQLAKDLIIQATGRAKELGIDITVVEREGDPFDEVVRLATELRADAVVVGASESPAHRIAGSLGVRLVKAKLCPVTVVP